MGLPVRVPSHPDVPGATGVGAADLDDGADAPDLDRIADFLSRPQMAGPPDEVRRDGFDIPAVIQAVRDVPGVREAEVRPNPNGVHTLRLDLADDADPAEVSRAVARLLKERMGLTTGASGRSDPTALGEAPHRSARSQSGSPNKPLPPAQPAPSRLQPSPPVTAPYPREAHRRRAMNTAPSTSEPVSHGPFNQAATAWGPPGSALGEPIRDSDSRAPADRGLPAIGLPAGMPQPPRAVIDQVKVTDEGYDAVIEVRLTVRGRCVTGVANGPAMDGYVLRLAATATATAVDQLIAGRTRSRGRCFVEHTTVVSLGGGCDVAVVVVLLAGDGWVDHLTGSALVTGDPRYAVVRATLSAVNRRLEALLG